MPALIGKVSVLLLMLARLMTGLALLRRQCGLPVRCRLLSLRLLMAGLIGIRVQLDLSVLRLLLRHRVLSRSAPPPSAPPAGAVHRYAVAPAAAPVDYQILARSICLLLV